MLSDLNMCTQEPIALNQTLRKCSFEVNLSYPTSQGLADFFYFTDGRQFTGTAGNLCTYDSEPTSWQNMESHDDEAFVSFISDDKYALGATVLGLSLKICKTSRKLVLLVTDGVCSVVRDELLQIWDELIDITPMYTTDEENLALTNRPELGITFTKLKIWTLTQFKKCVFLDADTLVLQNIDELFDREELSAAPDIGWPDCFNSGVFVFIPSMETYASLIRFSNEYGSFDGGDQGLLNMYFKDWATKDISYHLPFIYNMVSNICYSYAPAYKKFGNDAKVVHFLGSVKPWHHFFDTETSQVHIQQSGSNVEGAKHFIQMWWEMYNAFKTFQSTATGQSGSHVEGAKDFVQMWEMYNAFKTSQSTATGQAEESFPVQELEAVSLDSNTISDMDHKTSWERGLIDFEGEDRFENIQNHLDYVISGSEILK